VNAVVSRQARQLLYLETEGQSFVTTPEHPFATVDSGWVRAGELTPGDRVISAKFGSLRVSSVRTETRAQAVPVFNLRVERAHAYWAGSADVLVHNTGCGAREDNVTKKTREVEEIERQLAELKNGEAGSSSEQPLDRKNKIDALEAELKKAKNRLSSAKSWAKDETRRRADKTQRREDNITVKSREIEEAQRDLDALKKTFPTSSEHALKLRKEIAELKAKLAKLQDELRGARYRQKRKTQPELINQGNQGGSEILRGDALTAALAAAQAELHELERKRADSQDPTAAPGPREAELKKLIPKYTYDLEQEAELRELEDKLAELEKVVPTPDAPHPGLAAEKEKLKKLIKNNKAKARDRGWARRRVEDPEYAAKRRKRNRELVKRAFRRDSYVNDPTREPDTIDWLEQKVAELIQAPSSPDRDQQLKYYEERLESLKGLAALRLRAARERGAILRARSRKQTLIERGQDTTSIDEKLAVHEQQRKELVHRIAVEQAREILDGFDDGRHGASSADPASAFDQELLDQLLAEIVNEQAVRAEQLGQDTLEVDEEMRFIQSLLASPSPAPGQVSEAVARLSDELHEERAQFNDNHFALVNEYAYFSSTLGHDNPGAVGRMAEIQGKIQELKLEWQESTQKRLDETRNLLNDMRRTPRLRDETTEAELAEQIALLEHELAHPPF
jgi:hypothetical protein